MNRVVPILPIEMSDLKNHSSVELLSFDDDNNNNLGISDFPDEMNEVIGLDEELDRYFQFLSKLSRDELLTIVKYEVYNRILMQQDLKMMEKK